MKNIQYQLFVVATVLMPAWTVSSQDGVPYDRGIVGLARTMKQLQTTATVLHTVAHPDDEDGPLLAYCARGLGSRTLLFSITRGEGGANLIAPYFFDELGALRTLEHYKSAEYYGNELFYSHATDYGYSKTLEEANRQWDSGEPILEDLVELIRRERPSILLSRFRGDRRDGHGHHQMAGVLTKKAFQAAADPSRFSDQLKKGLRPWKVDKLYTNNLRPGRIAEDQDAWTVRIPTGSFDPLLGRSYSQVARFGLGFQRSQGISGHVGRAGARPSYYRLVSTHLGNYDIGKQEESLLDGLDTSISGLHRYGSGSHSHQALEDQLIVLQKTVDQISSAFHPQDVGSLVPQLVVGLKRFEEFAAHLRLDSTADSNSILSRIETKIGQLKTAILQASGLDIEFWIDGKNDEQFAIANQPIQIQARIVNPSSRQVTVKAIAIKLASTGEKQGISISNGEIADNDLCEGSTEMTFKAESITKPYWFRNDIREPFYAVASKNRQQPLPMSPATGVVELEIGGTNIALSSHIDMRFRDPELGNVRYPLSVVPQLSVGFPLKNGVVPLGHRKYTVDVELSSATSQSISGDVHLQLPNGWTANPKEQKFQISKANEKKSVRFEIDLPDNMSSQKHVLRAIATVGNVEFTEGFQTITARDLGRITLFKPALHQLQASDVKVSGNPRVAYISGSGDDVATSLAALNVFPKILSAQDLESGSLSQFDVILVGVRAYAVRPDLRKFNHRLLDYVKAGGTMIVQYQTPEFDHNFGPYPYKMGRRPEEVSQEDSKVTILAAGHPVFTRPNRITSADFDGWFEQRGSKFWASWDERYTPLLECHDTDQSPQLGGMLLAKYGKGTYIYSAYAWYRQLPNAVPGAFRIFANMLSLPETSGK